MDELESINLLFNAFAPFFVICFFLLDSMIYRNIKGVILLIGMSISSVIMFLASNSMNFHQNTAAIKQCVPFTINNSSTFANFPLTPNLLIFTFMSLIMTMAHNNFIITNLIFIFIMMSLITINILWLFQKGCFSTMHILFTCLISIATAVLWSYILNKSNNKGLIYTIGVSSNDTCQVPKRKTYKCKKAPKAPI
jgi:hypothetical protein